MRRHIEAETPRIGSLESLELSFARLRTMFLGIDGGSMLWAAAPLFALNKIRNKLAHRLDSEIAADDVKPLVDLLRQMDDAVDPMTLQKDPAGAIEAFAVLFGVIVGISEVATRKIADHEEKLRALSAESKKILDEFLGAIADENAAGV